VGINAFESILNAKDAKVIAKSAEERRVFPLRSRNFVKRSIMMHRYV
jgi:hypothetical protein